MYKYPVLFLVAILSSTHLAAQTNTNISGSSHLLRNGKAIIWRVAPNEFYSSIFKSDTVKISNSRFEFDIKMTASEQFRIELIDSERDAQYLTELFFADPGVQKISIDTTVSKYDLKFYGYNISSDALTNIEFKSKYSPPFDSVNNVVNYVLDALEGCYNKKEEDKQDCIVEMEYKRASYRKSRDSILWRYALENPSSKIIKWQLYESSRLYGYNDFYGKIFEAINPYLSQPEKKYLFDFLSKGKSSAVGSMLPLKELTGENQMKPDAKYTLIEYWFSGCGPCLKQFRDLKTIYPHYQKKGFEIIAISTDTKESLREYREVLRREKYEWKQVLDTGGVKSNSINIYKFPTSFLIDHSGKVLFKDINPFVLASFLKENL